jgi:N-acetylglucosamine kinase-like BadF-type ATPase
VDGDPEVATVSVVVAVAGRKYTLKLLETPPALASKFTFNAVLTDEAVAVNLALVPPSGTVTVAGTGIAALLLDKLTLNPPVGAAEVSVT